MIDTIKRQLSNLNTRVCFFIGFIHLGALAGLYFLPFCKWQTILFTLFLWPLSSLGITGGVHRLWSHRSYEAHWTVRVFLMLCSSIANQGSIFHWSRDHRVHHKFSETEADPHNAKRGFFFAHIGWLLVKKDPKVVEAGRKLNYDDLLSDPVVLIQYKLDPWFAILMCFVLPTLIPAYFWGESVVAAYFVPGVLRYCLVLHFTWLVNSAAHMFGDRPYDPEINPAENLLVSFFAIGEGWHNWHHTYPFDYAASEFGIISRYNPTKLFIDTCALLGLVSDRKRALGAWAKKKQMLEVLM